MKRHAANVSQKPTFRQEKNWSNLNIPEKQFIFSGFRSGRVSFLLAELQECLPFWGWNPSCYKNRMCLWKKRNLHVFHRFFCWGLCRYYHESSQGVSQQWMASYGTEVLTHIYSLLKCKITLRIHGFQDPALIWG